MFPSRTNEVSVHPSIAIHRFQETMRCVRMTSAQMAYVRVTNIYEGTSNIRDQGYWDPLSHVGNTV